MDREAGNRRIEAYVRLAEIEQVQYFKESSRDITKITRLIELIERAGKAHYFTTMQPLLMTLAIGGSGATMPPPGTRLAARVVRAFLAGDMPAAIEARRVFSTFPGKWAAYGLPPVMKCALRHVGIDLGGPASPYEPVGAADDAAIGEFLSAAGLRRASWILTIWSSCSNKYSALCSAGRRLQHHRLHASNAPVGRQKSKE